LSPRLVIAEAHQEQAAARLEDARQSRDILLSIFVREYVEQPAIDCAIERFGQIAESQGIHGQKRRFEAALGGFLARKLNGFIHKIDAGHLVSAAREEECVLACSTTGVEN